MQINNTHFTLSKCQSVERFCFYDCCPLIRSYAITPAVWLSALGTNDFSSIPILLLGSFVFSLPAIKFLQKALFPSSVNSALFLATPSLFQHTTAMPFIHTTVSTKLDAAKRANLTSAFKAISTQALSKPASFIMTAFNDESPMSFQDTTEPAACVRVDVYEEYPPNAPAEMTPVITAAVSKECGIPADRIYVFYYSTPYVGWNGNNF